MTDYTLLMMDKKLVTRRTAMQAENINEAIFKSSGIIPSANIRVKTAKIYRVTDTDVREVAYYDNGNWTALGDPQSP